MDRNIAEELELNIPIGTLLQIDIAGVSGTPVTSIYVGQSDPEYIIIAPPSPYATIKYKLFPGNELVIKYLSEGRVCAFKTKLIEMITKPVKAVFLEYPVEMQYHNLRTKDRIDCLIPATMVIRGMDKETVITDINTYGCGCIVHFLPQEKNLLLRKNEDILLKFSIPGHHEEKTVFGIARKIVKKRLEMTVGIQFMKMTTDFQNAVTQYISFVRKYI